MGRYKKFSKRKSSAARLLRKEKEYIPPKRVYTPNILIPERSTRSRSRNIVSSIAPMYLEKTELSTESSHLNSPKRRGQSVSSGSLGSSRNLRDRQKQHTRETNSSPRKRSVRFGSPSDKGTPNRRLPALVVSPLVSSSSPKPNRGRRSSSSSSRRQDPLNSVTSEDRTNSSSKLHTETTDFSPHILRSRVPTRLFNTSFASVDEDSYVDDHHRPQHTRAGRDGSKRSSQLPVSPKQQQQHQAETRQQLASRKRRFSLTDSVDAVPESPDSAGAAAPVDPIKRSCPQRRLLCKASADNTEIDQDGGDEASDEGDEGEDKQPDGRRYPIRARRNTAVYQVESNTHSNHAPHRNWLSGTGFEHYRRRNRYKSHRHLEHCGSSTPSSGDSSGGDSSSDASSPTRQKPRWRNRQPNASHRRHSASASPLQVDTDEVRFARRCTKSLLNARSELLPINMNREDAQGKSSLSSRLLSGTSLADIEPMSINESVGFEQVGGHEKHIESLKECILLPLMYPEVFTQFGIEPPRGVLFSGPPGTGKTLLARALANECGRLMEAPVNTGNSRPSNAATPPPGHRQIAFFMRKGADCLSKWVGESERQLRLLFDQAYRMRPSIIFFDEIDGLAPVRSSRQDQIHSSIVSTLLSLMDGLDNRAEVVIIGATNRPDAIDPALRRPGRFDREFVFQLPAEPVRLRILQVLTAKWQPRVGLELLRELAQATNNFSGADLKALVTEACLCCLRRRYPQVYSSQVKLALDRKCLVVTRSDWLYALRLVRPSNDRSDVDCAVGSLSPSASALASTHRCPLQPKSPAASLLTSSLDRLTKWLVACLYPGSRLAVELSDDGGSGGLGPRLCSSLSRRTVLLHGDVPPCLMAAVWHRLESAQIFTLNFTNLIAFPTSVGICPEAAIAQIMSAVRRAVISTQATATASDVDVGGLNTLPGVVVYLPCVDSLMAKMPRQTSVYLVDRLVDLLHASSNQQQHRQQSGGEELQLQPLLLVATLRRYRKSHLPADAGVTEGTGRPERQPSRTSGAGESGIPLVNGLPEREPVITRSETFGSAALALNGVRTVSTPVTSVNTTTARNAQVNGELSAGDGHNACSSSAETLSSSSTSTMDFSFSSGTDSDHSGLPASYYAFQSAVNNSGCCACPSPTTNDGRSTASVVRFLVRRLFPPVKGTRLGVRLPDLPARRALFDSLLSVVFPPAPSNEVSVAAGHRRRRQVHEGRAPTPPPVSELLQLSGAGGVPEPSVTRRPCPQYSQAELLALERQDAQLFRRLRQVLRRVVAHLARHRRFAVFTRPVQADDVPDYYEVIKQPMDLGAVRDKIDAHRYTDVTAFMRDIELIYRNALEYNPANVPRSQEIRSRASEFWDEACIQLEEELHPSDLDEQCRAAMEAQTARRDIAQTGSVKTTSAMGNPHPAGGSTAAVVSLPCTKTPPPMPSGGRYSRRLHGEDPVLASADILQLGAVRSRRGRHSRSASMVSEEQQKGDDDAQPRVELDEDESNLSALFTDEATSLVPAPTGTALGAEASFGKSPSLSETMNNISVLTVDDSVVATAKPFNPVATDPPRPVANPKISASSSDDASSPRDRDVPPTGDPVWAQQPGFAAADYRSLCDFFDRLARKTKGWNSDQLICLHRQLTVLCHHYRLRRQAIASSLVLLPGVRQLQADLYRVYMDHRIREEFEYTL